MIARAVRLILVVWPAAVGPACPLQPLKPTPPDIGYIGIRAKSFVSEVIVIQGWARSQNSLIVGFIQVVSSRVPAMISVMPGKPSASIKIIDPQRGQNLRSSLRPLSPVLVKVWTAPFRENASFGTARTSTNAEPLCF
jgi:hypothetical protein